MEAGGGVPGAEGLTGRQKLPTVDTLAPIRLGKGLSELFLLLFCQLEALVLLGNEESDGHTFFQEFPQAGRVGR